MALIDISYEDYEGSLNLDCVELEPGISVNDYHSVKAALIIKDHKQLYPGKADELITELYSNRAFTTAPASTTPKNHGCFFGGLLAHSINVYDSFVTSLEKGKMTLYSSVRPPVPLDDGTLEESQYKNVKKVADFNGKYGSEDAIHTLYKGSESGWSREKDAIFAGISERNNVWGREFKQLPGTWRAALNDVRNENVGFDEAISYLKEKAEEGIEGYEPLTSDDENKLANILDARNKWEEEHSHLTKSGLKLLHRLGDNALRLEQIHADSTARSIYQDTLRESEVYYAKINNLSEQHQEVFTMMSRYGVVDLDNLSGVVKESSRDEIVNALVKLNKEGLLEKNIINTSTIDKDTAVAAVLHDLCKTTVMVDGKAEPYYLLLKDKNGDISEKKPFLMNKSLTTNPDLYHQVELAWNGEVKFDFRYMKHGALSSEVLEEIVGEKVNLLENAIQYHMGPFDMRFFDTPLEEQAKTRPEALVCYQADLLSARSLDTDMDEQMKAGDHKSIVENVRTDPMFDRVMGVLETIKKEGRPISPEELISYLV